MIILNMAFVVFLLGLCCGSFINMLIFRTAVAYKLKSPIRRKRTPPLTRGNFLGSRSVCDFCGKQLNWFDNIPVISWLWLKGKSRCCGKKLPVLYPIVEIATGLLFLLNFQFSIFNFQSIFVYLILIFLMFSAVFDFKYMILPDFSTVILILLSLVFIKNINNVYCAFGASGFLYLLYLITKGRGMGLGDVKYAVFMGLFLGWPKTLIAFYIAFIIGAIVGVILMILKKKQFRSEIAFGPFLILGTILAWWWGEAIIEYIMTI